MSRLGHYSSNGACEAYGFVWFGGGADVLGKPLTLPKVTLTIIGIAPRNFIGETAGQQPDLWILLRMQTNVVPIVDWLHNTPLESFYGSVSSAQRRRELLDQRIKNSAGRAELQGCAAVFPLR